MVQNENHHVFGALTAVLRLNACTKCDVSVTVRATVIKVLMRMRRKEADSASRLSFSWFINSGGLHADRQYSNVHSHVCYWELS